ncbi:hypothetical protein CTAYLR_004294 [Chrysophaeum taylorii]|uniref:Core Histone H2A/H2B/H3 domain-containing protein n=1 Tax=Chrysophaeum taylorii TaxID=2483200 RepID=A0AAD7UG15_9STRA|nr:hypothetical protein CTAYLR_004294 [Chrysophaeum taylorii]
MEEASVEQLLEEQREEIAGLDATKTDFRSLELPLARIKKIMKMEDEIQGELGGRRCMVSSEAPVLFAKACEIFILELTARAWTQTELNKRRTLQRADVAVAVSRSDMYDFLIDVVPREGTTEITPKPDDNWQRRVAQHVFFNPALAQRLVSSAKRDAAGDEDHNSKKRAKTE